MAVHYSDLSHLLNIIQSGHGKVLSIKTEKDTHFNLVYLPI